MARPKTKGAPIVIRLSLEATAEAERRAAVKGMTVHQWVVDNLERGLGPDRRPPAAPVRNEVTPIPKKTRGAPTS